MASTVTHIPLKKDAIKQASRPRRAKTHPEKPEEPFDEAAALQHFKDLMLKHGGKHKFEGFVD
jgi:hypothetical protein